MVGARGFEPPASRSRTVRSTKLSYAPTGQPRVAEDSAPSGASQERFSPVGATCAPWRSPSTRTTLPLTIVRFYVSSEELIRRFCHDRIRAVRQNIYQLLDQVLDTGVPLEIERKGRKLRIVPEPPLTSSPT